MLIKDEYYVRACEEAKEDYFLFGVIKNDEDVEKDAENMRQRAKDQT